MLGPSSAASYSNLARNVSAGQTLGQEVVHRSNHLLVKDRTRARARQIDSTRLDLTCRTQSSLSVLRNIDIRYPIPKDMQRYLHISDLCRCDLESARDDTVQAFIARKPSSSATTIVNKKQSLRDTSSIVHHPPRIIYNFENHYTTPIKGRMTTSFSSTILPTPSKSFASPL